EIIFGDIVAKIIEQQEGIVVGGAAEAESAAEMDAGSFAGGLGFDEFSHGADGHGGLLPVSDIRQVDEEERQYIDALCALCDTEGTPPASPTRLRRAET